jgi:hypothetical protein
MRHTFRATVVSCVALSFTLAMTDVVATASTSRLASELITPAQFAKGWHIYTLSSGGVSDGCLSNVVGLSNVLSVKGVKQTANAKVFIEDHQSVPVVSELLATYSNVSSAYASIVKSLAACKKVNAKIFGVAVKGSMKETSLAHFGNASQAFLASTSVMGTTFDEDVVIIRKGDVVVGLIEGGLPPVNVHQFEGIVSKALARVP